MGETLKSADAGMGPETALAQENALLRAALKGAGLGIAVAAAHARHYPIEFCNTAFTRLTGLSRGGRLNPETGFLSPSDHAPPPEIAAAFEKCRETTAEVVIRQPGGGRFWAEMHIVPVTDDEGACRHITVTLSDIHDRKMKEIAKRGRGSQLAQAIEIMPDGLLLLDEFERVIVANRRFKEIYAEIADFVVPGAGFSDILSEMIRAKIYSLQEAPDSWIRQRLERLRDPSLQGQWQEWLSNGKVIQVAERRTDSGGYVSTYTDISAVKRVDSFMRSRVRAIDAADDAIALCDGKGVFTFANPAFVSLFGYESADDLIARSWHEVLSEADREGIARQAERICARNQRWRGNVQGLRRDGQRFPQELSLSSLDQGGFVIVTRDISERVAADEERNAMQAQLFQAQKMEAIGQLAGGIAHDFNNILTTITGNAWLLCQDLDEGTELNGFAQRIQKSAERAKHLVGQILAFSRPERGGKEVMDLRAVISESVEMTRAGLPASIGLETRTEKEPVLAEINPAQVHQVVINLCVNARDALEGAKGTLSVTLSCDTPAPENYPEDWSEVPRLSRLPGGRSMLRAGKLHPGRAYGKLTIADTGHGIGHDVLERIFEPFFTTKPVNLGTGLGLAAAYGIITAHDGLIEIETALGKGTAFSIFFPLIEQDQMTDGEAEEPDLYCRILVVDDETDITESFSSQLERLGFDPECVNDPREAIETVEGDPDGFDLLITDYTMPGMTGDSLFERIREAAPELPAILCTGFSDRMTPHAAKEAGFAAMVDKPVAGPELEQAIRQILREKSAGG